MVQIDTDVMMINANKICHTIFVNFFLRLAIVSIGMRNTLPSFLSFHSPDPQPKLPELQVTMSYYILT
jgi:hypothetical protein